MELQGRSLKGGGLGTRSKQWTLESAWHGNLLTMFSSISMLITLGILSQSKELRIIVPSFILQLVVALDTCLTLSSLAGCFLRLVPIQELSK
jgi:hypothetical protein